MFPNLLGKSTATAKVAIHAAKCIDFLTSKDRLETQPFCHICFCTSHISRASMASMLERCKLCEFSVKKYSQGSYLKKENRNKIMIDFNLCLSMIKINTYTTYYISCINFSF